MGPVDESADVLEHERSEPHLGPQGLGGGAIQFGQVLVDPAPRADQHVESFEQSGHPPGTEFDHRTAQRGELLEHAVEHHHRDKGLRAMVQNCEVLAPNVLAASHPIPGGRTTRVGPTGIELERRTADVEHKRRAALGQPGPERVEVDMARGAGTNEAVGNPDRIEAGVERPIEFGESFVDVVEGHDAYAHQAFVLGTELGHRPIVGPGGAVAKTVGHRCAGVKDRPHAVGRENELFREAEQVHGDGALLSVESPEGLDLLGLGDEVVAHRDLRFHVFGRVTPLGDQCRNLVVGHDRGGIADRSQLRGDIGVGVVEEEARELHDVTVGVVERSIGGCVSHGRP